MNQFIAIMKESLWSTLATRLLYFEIFGVLLLLLALAPLSYQEKVNFSVAERELRQPIDTLKFWTSAAERSVESPAKSLWESLPAERQSKLKSLVEDTQGTEVPGNPRTPSRRVRLGEIRQALAESLNYLVRETRFWDDPEWADRIDNQQTKAMWEQRQTLNADYQKRLARMIVQDSFRGQFGMPPESTAELIYGPQSLYPLPVSGFGLAEIIRSWLPFVLDKLFLTVGVLLAILVTASLIPQMLEEGSLYLLLSKPQTRVFLLLSKYVGGGLLILIISALFLTGAWLILGTRFGVWMSEILWCIPLAVTIFLVYYSVTVSVGLIFRNAILSIIVTILFAGSCYLLSFSRYTYSAVVRLQRTAEVQAAGDQIIRRTAHNQLQRYDRQSREWELGMYQLGREIQPDMFKALSMIMPTIRTADVAYLPEHQLLIGQLQNFPPQPGVNKRLVAARVNERQDFVKPNVIGEIPVGAVGLWSDNQGRVYTVTSYGSVFYLDDVGQARLRDAAQGKFPPPPKPQRVEEDEDQDDDGDASNADAERTGAEDANAESAGEGSAGAEDSVDAGAGAEDTGAEDTDEETGPIRIQFSSTAPAPRVTRVHRQEPTAAAPSTELSWIPAGNLAYDGPQAFNRVAFDATGATSFVLGRTSLSRAKRTADGSYQLDTSVNLPWDWTLINRIPLGWLRGQILLPLRGNEFLVMDGESLEPVAELRLPRSSVPLSLACDETLGIAVIAYANGETWVYRAEDRSLQRQRFVRGLASGATFTADQKLVIAHDVDDVSIVEMPSGKVAQTLSINKSLMRMGYDWGVEPLYRIFPKPNECYLLIQHLANNGQVDVARAEEASPEVDIDTLNAANDSPWLPLRSSVAFAVVLMLFNCWYFWRQEY